MEVITLNTSADVFQRGVRAFARREIAVALSHLHQAEGLGYDASECSAYRWQCWMLLGRYEDAWRESDQTASRNIKDPNALWDGEPFSEKRVVIRCLHGYGDAIQFLRYASLVWRTASRVIVETHPEMVSLVSCVEGVDEVTSWSAGQTLPREAWDQQIEVTELPRAFRTSLFSIPAEIPYIHLSEAARERSRNRLGGTGKPKVGLMWASSMWNPARCVPLCELWPLLQDKNWDFYSFQRGEQRGELVSCPDAQCIHDTSLHSPEIIDTAADINNIDVMVSVDTMAAHLAGALGIKTFLLLPYEADWRWMVDRDDSPWYPAMRLFRQTSPGDWTDPILRVKLALDQALTSFGFAGFSLGSTSTSSSAVRGELSTAPTAD